MLSIAIAAKLAHAKVRVVGNSACAVYATIETAYVFEMQP
jgi:hypothetical protein